MFYVLRNRIWVLSLLLVTLLLSLTAIAQNASNKPSSYEQAYADFAGVSVEEAKRRTELQFLGGELQAKLRREKAATFAGMWIEHKPQFQIVVQFTGN